MKITREEIERYASNAGFTGDDLKIAVAVALAESGGDTTAHNVKPPDNSYGLWQINMYGKLGPDRRKRFGLPDNTVLFDPARNAMVAKHIKDEQGWERGWTTYSSGKYKQFLDGSVGGSIRERAQDLVTGSAIGDAVNALGKNLFNGVASILGVSVALVLLILGVVILMRNQSTVKSITSRVKKRVNAAATKKVAG